MKDSIGSLPFDTKIICKTGRNTSELVNQIQRGCGVLAVVASKKRIIYPLSSVCVVLFHSLCEMEFQTDLTAWLTHLKNACSNIAYCLRHTQAFAVLFFHFFKDQL